MAIVLKNTYDTCFVVQEQTHTCAVVEVAGRKRSFCSVVKKYIHYVVIACRISNFMSPDSYADDDHVFRILYCFCIYVFNIEIEIEGIGYEPTVEEESESKMFHVCLIKKVRYT
jgi:hypothetical protein